ncbi:serine-rich adhesin for platelets-like [Teleopsis dalmanni]|uniref:serine-rich adhesin for platelets-like n=1 Tax=Teleopsis dalmanni TaxID=139649 RepID=UPI0018CF8D6B|nr:serine-rich adhesin for platelets-like [Teleopsis dalmanni]
MDDYITVVSVDEPASKVKNRPLLKRQSSIAEDSSFITVLTINNNNNVMPQTNNSHSNYITDTNQILTETVIVYRLPGERLGFGLKFQGGTRSTEKVQKLFIQSCAKDSPASKVEASWGLLREGDEIVSIDGNKVCEMTRIECVRCLKDNVAIKLEVRNGYGQKPETEEDYINGTEHMSNGTASIMSNGQSKGSPPPPPPVPPRKLVKRKSLKDAKIIENGLKITTDAVDKPFTPPPDAEYYINLFADGQSIKTESESDDTASTISTVIDKFSINSNYSSESDLSSFASLPNAQNVINKTDLAKVLKPFTMLEEEFSVDSTTQFKDCIINQMDDPKSMGGEEVKKLNMIPGNNYENVEFKTEKVNVYENVELKSGNDEKTAAPVVNLPTPKPRQVAVGGSSIEPKKRSIIPLPRKITTPTKLPIEVAPPKVPDTSNAHKLPNTPTTPTNETTPTKEFLTKIPKAIATVFSPNSLRVMERSKTESEIKLKSPLYTENLKQQTSMFLEQESRGSMENLNNKENKTHVSKIKYNADALKSGIIKSRIPVVLSPKNLSKQENLVEKKSNLSNSPSNIPRMLMQKQKSETDLKLGLYRSKSKESSPTSINKTPLQRTISAESKLKSPERTLIPIFSGQMSTSTESLSSNSTQSSGVSAKTKGPKPKPPERIQSLGKTNIPKLQTPNSPTANTSNSSFTLTITDKNATTATVTSTAPPTMQTFKQTNTKQTSPVGTPTPGTPPSPTTAANREIRFKIQTYESKVQESQLKAPFTDVNGNEETKMPSLFDLVHKNSPNLERKDIESTYMNNSAVKIHIKDVTEDETDDSVPAVGKCIKVSDTQPTYYSSTSSEDEDTDTNDENDAEKDYDCEDGEKLGPPEVINGPGPSEAYFNLYWHTNMLPTIGEVEEEFSSLEPQSLTNGPIVIVNDLSQQKATSTAEEEKSTVNSKENNSVKPATVAAQNQIKFKKPHFIGVQVLPPTVPKMETEENVTNKNTDSNESTAEETNENVEEKLVSAVKTAVEIKSENVVNDNASQNINNVADKITTAGSVNDNASEQARIDETTKTVTMQNIVDDKKLIVDNKVKSTNPSENKLEITNENLPNTQIQQVAEKLEESTNSKEKKTTQAVSISDEGQSVEQTTTESTESTTSSSSTTTTSEESTLAKENTEQIKTTKTTTTKKRIIKSTTSSSTSMTSSTTNSQIIDDKIIDALDDLPIEFKAALNGATTKINADNNKSPTHAPIAFTLQPYAERTGNTKITVLEERQFESDQKAYAEVRTRDADGEEKLQTSTETHKEHAKLKKIHSKDSLDELTTEFAANDENKPMTVTATAETRISELAENPRDMQSIARGILNLSESGKQLQKTADGGVEYTECEHKVQDTYEDVEEILSPRKNQESVFDNDVSMEPSLLREVSETITVAKNDEKQTTKRAETTKEIPKKGVKLLRKTEDEKRLEQEAQKLIDSYQKVRKEAEKLFQDDVRVDDEAGFDLSAYEESSVNVVDDVKKEEIKIESPTKTETTADFLKSERSFNDNEKETLQKQFTENETVPIIEPTATPPTTPTLMDSEPFYLLHKNIIKGTNINKNENSKVNINKINEIDQPEMQNTTKVTEIIKIEEVTKPLPRALKLVIEKADNVKQEELKIATNKPPVPHKREIKPTPTKRASIDATELLTKTTQPTSCDESTTPTNASPIFETPKPLERIIVGVEHQIEIPLNDKSPIITFASEDLPTENVGSPKYMPNVVSSSLSAEFNDNANTNNNNNSSNSNSNSDSSYANMQMGNELHLETINLPTEIQKQNSQSQQSQSMSEGQTTPTVMSTSSSVDSVKSAIEVIGVVESKSEEDIIKSSTSDEVLCAQVEPQLLHSQAMYATCCSDEDIRTNPHTGLTSYQTKPHHTPHSTHHTPHEELLCNFATILATK